MSKWDEFVNKLKRPSPDTLARIEYRSSFLNMMGLLFVSIILVTTDLWYIIFALIFGMGTSYAQGMSSYMKYQAICVALGKKKEDNDNKSPSRRIDRIIKSVFGKYGGWFTVVVSALSPYFIIDRVFPDIFFLLYGVVYILTIVFIYVILYYFIIYWIALIFYKEVKNGKERKRN